MSLFHLPVDQIKESDLKALKDNQVRENRTIEYKEKLPSTPEEDEKLCATVCSFANTAGGDVIFGIREKRDVLRHTGEPDEIVPLSDHSDEQRLRILNVLRSNIEPRIAGCRIEAIPVAGGYVCIFRIPRSWIGLHAVRRNESYRFYHRTSAGRSTMELTEIRAGFVAAVEGYERLHTIRLSRIAKIRGNTGAMDLYHDQPTTAILHIIPFSVMNPTIQYDVRLLENDFSFSPMHTRPGSYDDRFTFDGIVRYNTREFPPTRSYVQFFSNGIVEACSAGLMGTSTQTLFVQRIIEDEVLKALPIYLSTLRKLGATHPFIIALSLIRVKGLALSCDRYKPERVIPFREDDLIIPEVLIESDDPNIEHILRPVFDRIWNAGGLPGSMSYDEDGNRTRQ